jgi:hypothetical protein
MNTSNAQNSLCRPHSAFSPVFGSFITMEFEVQLASPIRTTAKNKYRFSPGETVIGEAYLLVPQGSGAKMGTVVGLLTMPGDHDSTKGWFRRLI